MRRLPFVMTSALALASGLNLLAQHSGGQHSAGGHSPSGGHQGLASLRPAGSSQVNRNRDLYPTYPTPIGLQPIFASGVTGINPGAIPTRPFGAGQVRGGERHRGSYSAPYGYYPFFNDYVDSSYSGGYVQNAPVPDQTANVTANLLGEQLDRLSAEVEDLKNQRDDVNPRPSSTYITPMIQPQDATPSIPMTLVLRDGKQLQTKSYAVMGQQIWDFSGQVVRKIDISSINLEASRKATEANGAEFPEIR